jgi:hypothetical protein
MTSQRQVPIIYTIRPSPQRLGWAGRLLALAIGLLCLAVLAVGLHLTPSPAGVGSHERLGLAPCSFIGRTGLPCPSCGMTTSFSHFARGQWLASLYVQPMGMALAAASAVTFWAGLYIGLTGRPAHRLLRFIPARYYVAPALGLAVVAWAWKIWIHVRGVDGWSN